MVELPEIPRHTVAWGDMEKEGSVERNVANQASHPARPFTLPVRVNSGWELDIPTQRAKHGSTINVARGILDPT